MKAQFTRTRIEALTLVELVVVIAIVAILAALLLLHHEPSRKSAQAEACANNLKMIGSIFTKWSQDHAGRLPMQVATTNGGSMELVSSGSAIVHFQTTTNYGMNRNLVICPSDTGRYNWDPHQYIADYSDTNVSYFVGVDASLRNPDAILAGDRHLQANGKPAKPGLFTITSNSSLSWSPELHDASLRGNILFSDGHVEFSRNPTAEFLRQGLATSRLAIP